MNFLQKIYKKSKEQKGFTLVEMIVVLVIIAILAAITIPALLKYIDKAREKQVVINARTAYLAAETTISEAYAANVDSMKTATFSFGKGVDSDTYVNDAEKLTGLEKESYRCDVKVVDYKITNIDYIEDGKKASMNVASSTGGAWTVVDAAGQP